MAFNFNIMSTLILSLGLFGGSFLLWLKIRSLDTFLMLLGFFFIFLARVIGSLFSLRLASGQPIKPDTLVLIIMQILQYTTMAASLIAACAFVMFAYKFKREERAL